MMASTGHPYGVKPWGNFLSSGGDHTELRVRSEGLGPYMGRLRDENIVDVLGGLHADDLARLSRCSRALYAFCHHADLWKALMLQTLALTVGGKVICASEGGMCSWSSGGEGPQLRYTRSWKETYLRYFAPVGGGRGCYITGGGAFGGDINGGICGGISGGIRGDTSEDDGDGGGINGGISEDGGGTIRGGSGGGINGGISEDGGGTIRGGSGGGINGGTTESGGGVAEEKHVDEPCAAATSEITHRHRPLRIEGLYSDVLHHAHVLSTWRPRPQWLAVDNCPRVHRPTLEAFRRDFEEPNRPVVITGVVDQWPAMQRWATEEGFQRAAGGAQARLHGGGVTFSLDGYWSYAKQQTDDLPLYIFDRRFADKCPGLAADYEDYVPEYFKDDLFALLGRDRPDYRWLIMGPARSGSSFHKDPNCTSAWNAVIRGSKKWVLFPPHINPPGVHPSADGLDLATPVTLAEWFENFYREASRMSPGPIECVCRAGDVMFVPRGWWHLVLNLEESIAITQNYVSTVGLPHVLSFLDEKRHLVSGLPDAERPMLYERFVSALNAHDPHLLQHAQAQRASMRASSCNGGLLKRGKKRAIDEHSSSASAVGGMTAGGSASHMIAAVNGKQQMKAVSEACGNSSKVPKISDCFVRHNCSGGGDDAEGDSGGFTFGFSFA